MENIVLTIHLILALALVGIVLLQRSEGGGLGLGGGGCGGDCIMSAAERNRAYQNNLGFGDCIYYYIVAAHCLECKFIINF